MSSFELGFPPWCPPNGGSGFGFLYPRFEISLDQTVFMTPLVLSIQSGTPFFGFLSASEGASRVLVTQWMQKFAGHVRLKSPFGAV